MQLSGELHPASGSTDRESRCKERITWGFLAEEPLQKVCCSVHGSAGVLGCSRGPQRGPPGGAGRSAARKVRECGGRAHRSSLHITTLEVESSLR